MAEPVQEGTEVLPATVSLKDEEVEGGEKSPCKEEEDEEEDLPHAEFLDIFEEGLARIVQDPLLCDLPIQVTLEEINSQVALEYGQAMTVRVCKDDGEVMPIVVVQNATVLDLKKAIRRFMELKQQREGGVKHISWRYVWRTFHLIFDGEKLEDDKMKLKESRRSWMRCQDDGSAEATAAVAAPEQERAAHHAAGLQTQHWLHLHDKKALTKRTDSTEKKELERTDEQTRDIAEQEGELLNRRKEILFPGQSRPDQFEIAVPPQSFQAPQQTLDYDKLPDSPTPTHCPSWQQFVTTEISRKAGNAVWLLCIMAVMFG
ncbi:SNR25 protein, partial [Polyodon spathula]|nr:SNR25 protein [Polyodon spathula]